MIWSEIKTTEEFDKLKDADLGETNRWMLIFKHSTRCGTSMIAKKEFEKRWTGQLPVHLINVVEDREVSNVIARKYQVRHESPQLLIIRNGVCVYHESHYGIDAEEAMKFVASFQNL